MSIVAQLLLKDYTANSSDSTSKGKTVQRDNMKCLLNCKEVHATLSCLKLHPYCKVKLSYFKVLLLKVSSSTEGLQKISDFCSRTFMAASGQSARDRVSHL